MSAKTERLTKVVKAVRDEFDADLFVYSGGLIPPTATNVVRNCCHIKHRRTNVVVVMQTLGGSADEAYRIARKLQREYKKVIACAPTICASAGTLFLMGAHEIVLGDQSALGPLDVQIRKSDELFEMTSGLNVLGALQALQVQAFDTFETTLLELKRRSVGQITLRTAMDVSQRLTTGLFESLYSQLDPLKLAEDTRLTRIAEEYGSRLNAKSRNLKPGALQRLIAGYPIHHFEIDCEEAEELFENVKRPTGALVQLFEEFEDRGREIDADPVHFFWTDEESKDEPGDNEDPQGTGAEGAAIDQGAKDQLSEDITPPKRRRINGDISRTATR